jgi:hypothetical protein
MNYCFVIKIVRLGVYQVGKLGKNIMRRLSKIQAKYWTPFTAYSHP